MTMLTDKGVDLTGTVSSSAMSAVIDSIRLAPSGGNVQPWDIYTYDDTIDLWLNRTRTSKMDVRSRGSLVAAGAAMYNGRVARNYHSRGGDLVPYPEGMASDQDGMKKLLPTGIRGRRTI